jgi:hypothetical protein
VFGVGDAHSPEEPEALDLPAEGRVGGNHKLVAGKFCDQPVEALVSLQVVTIFGKRRASRRLLEIGDSVR